VTPLILAKYLIGNREAILRIAHCRQALWIGLIFVLSAGLAREYDGADLVHEPWMAIVPVGASLATSFLLYLLVRLVVPWPKLPETPMPFWGWYRKFLGLYWATAPLAWLYAIPVERFMTPGNATRANFLLLAIVSVWRVSLITRVISVLWRIDVASAFWTVMLFADSVALVAARLTPKPIWSVMGGVRLSEREALIQEAVLMVGVLAFLSWIIWLIGTIAVASRLRMGAAREPKPAEPAARSSSASAGLWVVAIASLVVWAFILPHTQPEQINRRIVETQLRAGQIPEAVCFMSQHTRKEFPPLWDPPPQLAFGEYKPGLIEVLSILASGDVPPSFREVFADKLMTQVDRFALDDWDFAPSFFRVLNLPDDELDRFVKLLRAIPEGPKIAHLYRHDADDQLTSKESRDYDTDEWRDPNPRQPLTARRKEVLKSLRGLSDAIEAEKAKAAAQQQEESRRREQAFRRPTVTSPGASAASPLVPKAASKK
jgi:hypothetical protein